jgi:hypothetical protein
MWLRVCVVVFNATFNNISVLLVEETRVPWENNVVYLALSGIPHNFSGDRH